MALLRPIEIKELKGMPKTVEYQVPKEPNHREITAIVADIVGVTPDYVRKVLNGENNNEQVMTAYMEYLEGKKRLIKAVKELVPFVSPR